MMTVNEVSKLTGLSVRTLHYYDEIGLLSPSRLDNSGYRLYDDTNLQRLQQIMLFRELEFPLKDIKRILDNPEYEKGRAIDDQIKLLTLKRDHLDRLIKHAREIKLKEDNNMDFTAFDSKKLDEYAKRAKEQWGGSEAYKEYEKKTEGRSKENIRDIAVGLMKLFEEFGQLMQQGCNPESEDVQETVRKLQNYISENYYTCTEKILSGLGQMYAAGGEFTENIDSAGGKGTAEFASKAIEIYCR